MSFEALLIDENRAPDIVDESGAPAVTYLGWVVPGTVDPSEAKFKIKRVSVAAGITTTHFADGNRNYDKVWNDRAALNYSYLK
jgi:hypothetical protein